MSYHFPLTLTSTNLLHRVTSTCSSIPFFSSNFSLLCLFPVTRPFSPLLILLWFYLLQLFVYSILFRFLSSSFLSPLIPYPYKFHSSLSPYFICFLTLSPSTLPFLSFHLLHQGRGVRKVYVFVCVQEGGGRGGHVSASSHY